MRQTRATTDVAAVAAAAAARVAARAGLDVAELDDLPSIERASQLFADIWHTPGDRSQMPVSLMRALAHAGSYVAGASLSGTLVGAIVGFVGIHDARLVLHSHILGVVPAARGRSVGFALKLHQRAWALARHIDTIMWTFDPLVRRNAFFNLSKLGAIGSRYEANFYGAMDDEFNAADETDRLVAEWQLLEPGVVAAAEGRRGERDITPDAAGILLDVAADGSPLSRAADGDTLWCRIPEDVVALRRADPAVARRWRYALRDTLGAAVNDGYVASGMTLDGWYTLTPRGWPC